MSLIQPEIEIVDSSTQSVRYLEHGWPSPLCRWHAHEAYELHLLVATKGKAFVGDYIGTFDPGSLFLTGALLPHNWITDENQHEPVLVRDRLVQFDAKGISGLASSYPEFQELDHFLTSARCGIEFIDFDFSEADQRMRDMRDCKGLERVLLCFDFLRLLNRWPHKKTLSFERVINKSVSKTYDKIVEVIEFTATHYTRHITLEEVSSMAGMSQSAFSRSFQKMTGNRFSDFLNRVRVGQACRRLYETNDQISRICFEVGFRNLANFNRQFAKIKSMTPKAYRKQAQTHLSSESA
ncbi:MAG: AraC family transcriptional regulator [Pseudomonadota bacterium]